MDEMGTDRARSADASPDKPLCVCGRAVHYDGPHLPETSHPGWPSQSNGVCTCGGGRVGHDSIHHYPERPDFWWDGETWRSDVRVVEIPKTRRAKRVLNIVASAALEGRQIEPALQAELERYVDGEISARQLVEQNTEGRKHE